MQLLCSGCPHLNQCIRGLNLPCFCPTSHLPYPPLTIPADSLPADTTKTVTTIRNSGSRLLNLINDILDAAALRKVSAAPGVGVFSAPDRQGPRVCKPRTPPPPHHAEYDLADPGGARGQVPT